MGQNLKGRIIAKVFGHDDFNTIFYISSCTIIEVPKDNGYDKYLILYSGREKVNIKLSSNIKFTNPEISTQIPKVNVLFLKDDGNYLRKTHLKINSEYSIDINDKALNKNRLYAAIDSNGEYHLVPGQKIRLNGCKLYYRDSKNRVVSTITLSSEFLSNLNVSSTITFYGYNISDYKNIEKLPLEKLIANEFKDIYW